MQSAVTNIVQIIMHITIALTAALLSANLYPDPRLPSFVHDEERRALASRVSQLERALEQSNAKLESTRTTPGKAARHASDTVNLRLSLILWALLGTFSAVRLRFGKAVPAGIALITALVGGSFTLFTLLQTLIDGLKRTLGLGAPRLRCYRCMTVFEVPIRTANVAACPVCGTANQLIKKKSHY